jgi:hypothetical protein
MSEMADLMTQNIFLEARMQNYFKALSKANHEQITEMRLNRAFLYLPQCEMEG